MTKRIGILGGISHESTLAYYNLLLRKYFAHSHNAYYPEIVIFSLDFQKFTDFENSGDRIGYIAYILEGVRALQAAGAEFILMAANSPHAVFKEVAAQANVPMLSIVTATAQAALQAGVQRLLLLGIKFTMQATFYQQAFAQVGLTVVTPTDAEQDEVNRLIFAELVLGQFTAPSKQWLLALIAQYTASHAIDGVILGCTELPLLLKPTDCALPLLNTLELHVDAALAYALS